MSHANEDNSQSNATHASLDKTELMPSGAEQFPHGAELMLDATDTVPLVTERFLNVTDKVPLTTERFLGMTDQVPLVDEGLPSCPQAMQRGAECFR